MADATVFLVVLIVFLVIAHVLLSWWRPVAVRSGAAPTSPVAEPSLAILAEASMRARIVDFEARIQALESRLRLVEASRLELPADWLDFRREMTIQVVALRDRVDALWGKREKPVIRSVASPSLSPEQVHAIVYRSKKG